MSSVGEIFTNAHREQYVESVIGYLDRKAAYVRDDARQIVGYVRNLSATTSECHDRARGSIMAARMALEEALASVDEAVVEYEKGHKPKVNEVANG